jgi:hypothetical protein
VLASIEHHNFVRICTDKYNKVHRIQRSVHIAKRLQNRVNQNNGRIHDTAQGDFGQLLSQALDGYYKTNYSRHGT